MAYTKISDLIVPEIFTKYMIQESVDKNAFIKSGIAAPDPAVNITAGGTTVNVPFFESLDAEDEIITEDGATTINSISAAKDVAAVLARTVGFGATDLSRLFSGEDPMKAIIAQLGNLWAKRFTEVIKNVLKGIFGVAALSDNVLDNATHDLSAGVMTDAMYLLGDNSEKVSASAMHSQVLAKLKKLDILDRNTFMPSAMHTDYQTYMGRRVIVDDTLAATSDVYPIYLFGNGAIAFNENPELATVETDRDIVEHKDVLVTNRVFTMHPRGVKWIGTAAGETPINTELATSTKWELVENPKNVKIACVKTLIS